MYYPSEKEFLKLSKEGNVIAVYKEISADLDTPISAFLKIRRPSFNYLLESVEGIKKVARFSFLGTQPRLILRSKGERVEILGKNTQLIKAYKTQTDPLDEIKKIMSSFKYVSSDNTIARFSGGFVGYMGYDMVRFFEDIPNKNPDYLRVWDSTWLLIDTLLIFDHLYHKIKIVANALLSPGEDIKKAYSQAIDKIENLHKQLKTPLVLNNKQKTASLKKKIRITSNFKKQDYLNVVKKAKRYIRQGEIIQVVPSQCFEVNLKDRCAFDIYRRLRSLNPSSYMFFLEFKDLVLCGSSPEVLVRCEKGTVVTRPIAGTRRRGKTEKEDSKLEKQLLESKKERAEHVMLVDLGRNDLGRVCRYGTVKVTDFMRVEKYSHVMHLVSEVEGALRKDKDVYDCLRATFPAGTVTGSPKVRAMQIIDQLEKTQRGPYAGCVGYFSFSGNLDTCITIRTILIKGKTAYIQAGGGIVSDSSPEKEYEETVNKAKAQIEAIANSGGNI